MISIFSFVINFANLSFLPIRHRLDHPLIGSNSVECRGMILFFQFFCKDENSHWLTVAGSSPFVI